MSTPPRPVMDRRVPGASLHPGLRGPGLRAVGVAKVTYCDGAVPACVVSADVLARVLDALRAPNTGEGRGRHGRS
jgi:hypothetical protein